jgi:ribonuclease Z
MTELVILGSAAATPTNEHHNTHMALVDSMGVVLIDCGGLPTIRLSEAGIELDQISDIILTHFHPDHVGGLPLLLMNMWLHGRAEALRIYGLHHTLERVEDLMGLYYWENWPHFFPVSFHRLPEQDQVKVLENQDHRIFSSPVKHVVPTIALRVDFLPDRFHFVYSSDTEPCQAVLDLARGADLLLHEATGASVGHSTGLQAAKLAQEAEVSELLLIHYPPEEYASQSALIQAQSSFSGKLSYARDLMRIAIPK